MPLFVYWSQFKFRNSSNTVLISILVVQAIKCNMSNTKDHVYSHLQPPQKKLKNFAVFGNMGINMVLIINVFQSKLKLRRKLGNKILL